MTTYTTNKNIPVPDQGQQDWSDEVSQAFDIIDNALKDVSEASIDKSAATFNGVNIDASISLDDGVEFLLGTDGDLSIAYNSSSNETHIVDESTGDILFTLSHGSGAIKVGRALTDASTGNYYATEQYADSTAQSTATNVVAGNISPASVDTGSLTIDGTLIQAALDGHVSVVGAGLGMSDAIDPSSTTTPVQDAVDTLPTAGGTVIIPPQGVSEDTTVSIGDNVSLIGFGPGNPSNPISEITFGDAGNDCIVLDNGTTSTVQQPSIDGIHISGPTNTGATGRGLSAPNGVAHLYIGHISFSTLGGAALNITSWDEMRIEHVHAESIEPQHSGATQIFNFASGGTGGSVGLLSGYPKGDASDSALSRCVYVGGGQVTFDSIDCGGVASKALVVAVGAMVNCNSIVHEPNGLTDDLSTAQNAVCAVHKYGSGSCTIGHVRINSGSANITWDSGYIAGGATSSNWEFGLIHENATIDGPHVNVQTDTDGSMPSIWHGFSSQVTNNSGATLTNPVVCLGDLSTVS